MVLGYKLLPSLIILLTICGLSVLPHPAGSGHDGDLCGPYGAFERVHGEGRVSVDSVVEAGHVQVFLMCRCAFAQYVNNRST